MNKKYIPRLKEKYIQEIVPELKKRFGYKNDLAVPRLLKIVINMGIGEAVSDPKLVETFKKDLSIIAGQMPKITRARKAISNFKIRKGMAIGCMVTLRKNRMYEFLDRFITIAAPRIRDFRGFSPRGFDGQGNYNFGLPDQTIFSELDIDKIEKTQGMNITICTSAETDEECLELLKLIGFPFRK